jgi:hypothetical protein
MGSMGSTSDYDHLPSQEELDQTHIQLVRFGGSGLVVKIPKSKKLKSYIEAEWCPVLDA